MRTRTIEWADPAATNAQGRDMSGMEYLLAFKDGRFPKSPIMLLLGIDFATIETSRVVMTMHAGEHLYNPLGTVHGGAIATLLDSVMGCAVHTTLPKGRFYTTLELKVNFIRAMTEATGEDSAEGRVIHSGRQSAVAEAKAMDQAGRILAAATTTCLVFDLK